MSKICTDSIVKPELLAPGGDLSKALTALKYGADAVYIGGEAFGLRAAAGNFTSEDIDALLAFAHPLGKKVYVTLNILPRTAETEAMAGYAKKLYEKGVDGVIVADIGAMLAIRRAVPELPIHVSTQANTLNLETCRFWASLGARRVNLARELSLSEIEEINCGLKNDGNGSLSPVAPSLELEVFVHGAMCMAYSGRCMLSDYLTGRSSNRGECAQPCRWEYTPYILSAEMTEEKRPGQKFGIEETERGTFLFNSRDLCLLPYLPELIRAGAAALKIEGRMKSEYYVAVTVRAYRIAIDRTIEAMQAGESGKLPEPLLAELMDEVSSVSHREYSDGFFNGGLGQQVYGTSSYVRTTSFAGIVTGCEQAADQEGYIVTLSQRGNFGVGDAVQLVQPGGPVLDLHLSSMSDADGNMIDRAPHACMTVRFRTPYPVAVGAMLRKIN